jgi:NADH:ubiquinone oxidoreductase subunit K
MERQRCLEFLFFFTVGGGMEMMGVEIIISLFKNKEQVEVAQFKTLD